MDIIGKKIWAIAEGYIPPDDTSKTRQLISHEAACILNAGEKDAHIEITIYFRDKDPIGPYLATVPARRTFHLRFNDLDRPARIPSDTDFSSVFISDQPIVVQHTRLDSRSGPIALMSTMAYPVA